MGGALRVMFGLVFSGGGGKGAYEAGVWRALDEMGITGEIRGVSGTSVGALNAAMFAAGGLERAERVWKNISPDKVLTPRGVIFKTLMGSFSAWSLKCGFFTQSGLRTLIDENVAPHRVRAFDGCVYAACSRLRLDDCRAYARAAQDFENIMSGGESKIKIIKAFFKTAKAVVQIKNKCEPEYFDLTKQTNEQMKNILLASAAIPFVFPQCRINNNMYVDGGVCDNTPITPLYRDGIREFIVVYLGKPDKKARERFPEARLINIVPSGSTGESAGTFNFTAENAKRLMKMGYSDAKRAFL